MLLDKAARCDVDAFDTFLVFCFCFIVVACSASCIKLIMIKEYIAAAIVLMVGMVFFRDICSALRRTKKEISQLEKDIDKDKKILLGLAYYASTCRTCSRRFNCTNAYGSQEVHGQCSLNRYEV